MKIETDIIVNEFGKLKSVTCYSYTFENESPLDTALQLKFENGEVFHEALADTDELTCASVLNEKCNRKEDISNKSPWVNSIGKTALWVWNLTNQQGYNDAIQYEFTNHSEVNVKIQLMVECSEIKVFEIK